MQTNPETPGSAGIVFMKRCPECRRDYYDDTLSFCLDDGARLLEGPASLEPTTEILAPADLASESPTRQQIETTNEAAISPSETGEIARERPGVDRKVLLLIGASVLLVAAI